jgi:hypothetical protein
MGIITFPPMLAVLFIAASLAAQAWIFRDTPGHPADPCARSVEHCPEEGLDSLFARRAESLERQRALARGETHPAPAPVAAAVRPAPVAPKDSFQAEACRLLVPGE